MQPDVLACFRVFSVCVRRKKRPRCMPLPPQRGGVHACLHVQVLLQYYSTILPRKSARSKLFSRKPNRARRYACAAHACARALVGMEWMAIIGGGTSASAAPSVVRMYRPRTTNLREFSPACRHISRSLRSGFRRSDAERER